MLNSKLSRIICFIIAIAMTAVLLTSCGSSMDMDMATTESAVAEYAPENGYYDGNYEMYSDAVAEEPMEEEIADQMASPSAQVSGTSTDTIQRKIIKNGDMALQADDVTVAYTNLSQYVESIGGYEFSYNFSEDQYDGSSYIDAVFKLPPDKLTDVMQYAGNCAKILRSGTSSDDITNEYYDYKTRLETMEKSLESYYSLLEKAQTTEAIISIQSTINDLTVEIESIKGQIKLYDSLTNEATLTVTISQTPVVVTEDVEWDSISLKDMGRLSSNGFITVVNGIWSVLQWLIIIIISISPILLIVAIIVVIIVICVKSSAKKKAKKAEKINDEINDKFTEKK